MYIYVSSTKKRNSKQFDHDEGSQNLEKYSKNTSGRKKYIQEENINENNQESQASIIPELQNRVTHYDVTSRVTNSKILLFFF